MANERTLRELRKMIALLDGADAPFVLGTADVFGLMTTLHICCSGRSLTMATADELDAWTVVLRAIERQAAAGGA